MNTLIKITTRFLHSSPIHAWQRTALLFLITTALLIVNRNDIPSKTAIAPTLFPSSVGELTAENDMVYIETEDNTIKALQANNGADLWDKHISSGPYTIKVVGQVLYMANAQGWLQALKTSDGSVLWTRQLSPLLPTSPLMIVSDGSIYVSTRQGLVEALRASDGASLWQYQSGQRVPIDSFVSATNGVVAIRTRDGVVHIFQANNGKPIMNYQADPVRWWPLTEGGMIYISTSNGLLQAMRISDGKLLWQRPGDHQAYCCWTLAGGILYLNNSDHIIQAINGEDGKVLWQYDTDRMSEMLLIQDQACYVVMSNGSVVKLRGKDGVLLWQREFGYLTQGLLGAGNVLFSGRDTISVQAWSGDDGRALWEYKTRARIRWQPQVVNGRLYLLKLDGTLDVLNMKDGKTLWRAS